MAGTMATPAAATKKWGTNAAGASASYVANATAAANSQAQNAIAQADSWLQGVTTAGTKSFVAGITSAAQENKYPTRVQAVGGTRYAQGVGTQQAQQTFQTQITKVLNVEASVPLSPKGPKGSQANINRSTEMQQALRAAKLNGQFA